MRIADGLGCNASGKYQVAYLRVCYSCCQSEFGQLTELCPMLFAFLKLDAKYFSILYKTMTSRTLVSLVATVFVQFISIVILILSPVL